MKIVESEHQKWALLCVCFTAFVWRLDLYTVTISLPTISRHYDVGTDTVAFVVICYSLLLSSSLLIVGRMEDIYGLKRLLIWGFLIFSLGALCASGAPSIFFLILARCVQGVAGAILISSIYALVSSLLPVGLRGSAFGLVSASAALGVAVGNPLGGAIAGWLSWRGVFFLDLLMGIIGAAIAFKALPAGENTRQDLASSFDIPTAVLSFLSLFLMLFALNRSTQLGWDSPAVVGSLSVSLILGVLFVFRERKSTFPLVDLTLIGSSKAMYAFLVGVCMFAALSGNAFLMPFYLEIFEGMTPQLSGSVFLTYSLAFALTSPIVERLADSFPPRLLVIASLVLGAGACIFFSATLGGPGKSSYIIFLFLFGVSAGLFLPPNNRTVMALAPENAKGAFSSLYSMFNNLGWAIGACLSEAVVSQYVSTNLSSPVHGSVSRATLVTGFKYTYLLAAVLILVALILSTILLALRSPPRSSIG